MLFELNQEKLKQTLKVDPILVKKANPNAYPTTEYKIQIKIFWKI